METYLTIDFAAGYDTTIQTSRRLTEEEKERYAEWFRDIAFTGKDDSIRLPYVRVGDRPDRECDGMFISTNGWTYIITEKEKDFYIALNENRKKEKEKRDLEELAESYCRRIEVAERQLDLPTKAEAKRRMKAWNDLQNEGGEG